MAKALALLACLLAAVALSASEPCDGPLLKVGCPCQTRTGGGNMAPQKCEGPLLCKRVNVLGAILSPPICVLPPTCKVLKGLDLGCKCERDQPLLSGACFIPTVTSVLDSTTGLPVTKTTNLLGSLLGRTISSILPGLPSPRGKFVPTLYGTVCDLTKELDIPFGCPCGTPTGLRPCSRGGVCKDSIANSVLMLLLLEPICLPL